MSGHLSDAGRQGALKTIEEKARLQHLIDLEKLLKTDWGRRLLYRYIYVIGDLDSGSFNEAIKDGGAAALHCALHEGRRNLAREMMLEAQANYPDRWIDVVAEATKARAADLERFEKTTQSASQGEE